MYLNNYVQNNDSHDESRGQSVLSLILNYAVSKLFQPAVHPGSEYSITDGNGGRSRNSREVSKGQGSESTTTAVPTESYAEYLLESIFGGGTGSEKQESRTMTDACDGNREAGGRRI